MKRFRFHIGTLVILVLLVGVGLAALRESNDTWDSSIFTLTLGILLTSILLAIHRTEKRRAFWLGFAVFASTYLVLALVPSIESRLITSKALHYLGSKVTRSIQAGPIHFDPYEVASSDVVFVNDFKPSALSHNNGNGGWIKDVTSAAGSNTPWLTYSLAGPPLTGSSGITDNFVRIGHSLVALVVASLGGYMSRRLYANNREAVKESVVPNGSTSSDRSGS